MQQEEEAAAAQADKATTAPQAGKQQQQPATQQQPPAESRLAETPRMDPEGSQASELPASTQQAAVLQASDFLLLALLAVVVLYVLPRKLLKWVARRRASSVRAQKQE